MTLEEIEKIIQDLKQQIPNKQIQLNRAEGYKQALVETVTEVKDNFLDDVHLLQLDEIINNPHFAWYFFKSQVVGAEDGCLFSHSIYNINTSSQSPFYNSVIEIFKNKLKYVSLYRITANLLLKQENPSISIFHTDFQHLDILDEKKLTTAIFYLNTNNGYTEFKDGNRIDCIRNRLVMFPTTTPHRAIGQTDVIERIVVNFNFIL